VNGLSNDGFQWSGLVPTLKKEHAVLAWDYRGHGCSEDPRDVNAVSIESLAEDMQLVLDDVDNR
jgi:pimeloyl-ACP methyl ester carboxylesterase